MTTSQTENNTPKKRNLWIWCCLIALVLVCLVSCCLVSVFAIPVFARINPRGADLPDQFREFFPWDDFLDNPSIAPYLPESYDAEDESFDEYEDSYSEDSTPIQEDPLFLLIPYLNPDFPFTFTYPGEWEIMEEFSENLVIFDPASDTILRIGRDWLCQGCVTASDASIRYMEILGFQAEPEDFRVVEDNPFAVSTGDDAHYNAYEWIDFDGNYHWSFTIFIISDDHSIYFILEGESPEYFDQFEQLIQDIGKSFSN